MKQNLRITVDGRAYSVTVENMTASAETFYPSPNMRTEDLEPALPAAPAATVPSGVSAGSGDVTSPMTGVLSDFMVKVGDKVSANQEVAQIEAMKMKTSVMSQVSGTVSRLHVEPGASVDAGQILVSVT